jgi:hypothetical protein
MRRYIYITLPLQQVLDTTAPPIDGAYRAELLTDAMPNSLFAEGWRWIRTDADEHGSKIAVFERELEVGPQSVPADILEEIAQHEARRLNDPVQNQRQILADSSSAYFRRYLPHGMAYSGPLVVILYPSDPHDNAIFIQNDDDKWVLLK